MDLVFNACDRRDGDDDGHCYKIQAVMNVIDLMAMVMVMEIVLGLKL